MERILFVKLSALGDIIQSLGALHFVIKQVPNCKIDWVVEEPFAHLLLACPYIHRVIICNTKKWRRERPTKEIVQWICSLRKISYDMVIDLQGNCKSGLVTFFAKAKAKHGFDSSSVSEWPNLFFTRYHYSVSKDISIQKQYVCLVEQIIGKQEKIEKSSHSFFLLSIQEKIKLEFYKKHILQKKYKNVFMICFSSRWENKRLDPHFVLSFLQYLRKPLASQYLFIWKEEQEKKEAIWYVNELGNQDISLGDLSIPLWHAIMQEIDLVISMDSSSLHLAALTSTPTYAFFGPSKASIYNPIGANHGYYQGSCPHSINFTKRCPLLRKCVDGGCLKQITLRETVDHFLDWWYKVISKKII